MKSSLTAAAAFRFSNGTFSAVSRVIFQSSTQISRNRQMKSAYKRGSPPPKRSNSDVVYMLQLIYQFLRATAFASGFLHLVKFSESAVKTCHHLFL